MPFRCSLQRLTRNLASGPVSIAFLTSRSVPIRLLPLSEKISNETLLLDMNFESSKLKEFVLKQSDISKYIARIWRSGNRIRIVFRSHNHNFYSISCNILEMY